MRPARPRTTGPVIPTCLTLQLTSEGWANLKSQIATSKSEWQTQLGQHAVLTLPRGMGADLLGAVSPGGDDIGWLAGQLGAFGRHVGAFDGFAEGEDVPGEGI